MAGSVHQGRAMWARCAGSNKDNGMSAAWYAVCGMRYATSFLFLLNFVNAVLVRPFYCGLLGRVAWGTETPGTTWLSMQMEEILIVQLGYLGLILLLVYICFSLSISHLISSDHRQADCLLHASLSKPIFALSSTVTFTGVICPIALLYSLQGLLGTTPVLGTNFTVLTSSGLSRSRLGFVLTSAAIMDDGVGLVMVQVISNLGGHFSVVTVVRPIVVSLVFAIQSVSSGASYAGTSSLFAAYIAVSYPLPNAKQATPVEEKTNRTGCYGDEDGQLMATQPTAESNTSMNQESARTGRVDSTIVQPFFFASIGFSILISRMFSGATVWYGIVYATKLVRLLLTPGELRGILSKLKLLSDRARSVKGAQNVQPFEAPGNGASPSLHQSLSLCNPHSLQSLLIPVFGMNARDEIGFLNSAVVKPGGVFTSSRDTGSESSIFLVATWTIVLCTIIGSISVGLSMRRVRALEEKIYW
ncbi:hypothetical protein K504DRAFT_478576 [Pleomassaria siparia CBS 279.74]|uniref:Cation/H+ exchanger domain-containing protein n=1 Tax=Pleomassaria siparia CBS 279.74 TaxID=1314801 RepID=A0A6G1KRC2_9PLEO|nr:hypothetical protein K504DRAFT_478576 [Pleomassaria siparia CBS 279.74]